MRTSKGVFIILILLIGLVVSVNYTSAFSGSHSYSSINLPGGGGVWTGLDADTLGSSGYNSNDFLNLDKWFLNSPYIYYNINPVLIGPDTGMISTKFKIYGFQASNPTAGILIYNSTGGRVRLFINGSAEFQNYYVFYNLRVGNPSTTQVMNIDGRLKSDGLCLTTNGCISDWVWEKSGSDIYYNEGNVGIGTSNPQSILDIVSTSQGFVLPRMTTDQRNSIGGGSPPDHMIIYNTDDHKINHYDDTMWWTLTGIPN